MHAVSDGLRGLYMYLNTKNLPQDVVGTRSSTVVFPRKIPEAVVQTVSGQRSKCNIPQVEHNLKSIMVNDRPLGQPSTPAISSPRLPSLTSADNTKTFRTPFYGGSPAPNADYGLQSDFEMDFHQGPQPLENKAVRRYWQSQNHEETVIQNFYEAELQMISEEHSSQKISYQAGITEDPAVKVTSVDSESQDKAKTLFESITWVSSEATTTKSAMRHLPCSLVRQIIAWQIQSSPLQASTPKSPSESSCHFFNHFMHYSSSTMVRCFYP